MGGGPGGGWVLLQGEAELPGELPPPTVSFSSESASSALTRQGQEVVFVVDGIVRWPGATPDSDGSGRPIVAGRGTLNREALGLGLGAGGR